MTLPQTPSMRLDGKRAMVTGAGRGIGLGLACGLAEAGAHVTLVARSADEITSAAQDICEAGGKAEAAPLDVLDMAAMAQFFAGRPAFDILINNAGTNRPKHLLDVDETDYDAVMNLNVKACYFTSQAAVKRMVEENIAGSLIHIGSQMGQVGPPTARFIAPQNGHWKG